MRTSNPALNPNIFMKLNVATDTSMTVKGTVNKIGMLLLIVTLSASFIWGQTSKDIMWLIPVSAIAGLILALITIFKPVWSPFTAPVYSICEGLLLGAITFPIERIYPGIAVQAICLTFGTLFTLLLAYQSGWIKATEKFKMGIFAATGGICVLYLVNMVLGFFHMQIPFLHQGGAIGIGISLVIVVIAALNLILDFDFIEQGAASGAPKYMEWYGAFGLMVTLIWLYIEILNLLSKLRKN